MLYIILVGDVTFTLDSIKAVQHYGSISSYDIVGVEGRYCIDYGEDHIFYDYDNDIIYDYEESKLKNFPFNNPHFIMMTYRSEDRMKEVLCHNDFPKGIYVDNGFGLIVTIEEFIIMGMPVSTWEQQ